MATLELSNRSHELLEQVLKKHLKENRSMMQTCPSLASKLRYETQVLDQILQLLLRTPRLSDGYNVPTEDGVPKANTKLVAPADRPKYAVARRKGHEDGVDTTGTKKPS